MLTYLGARPGQVVSRAELLGQVWGYAPGVQSRAVDQTVRRLRKKLDTPSQPRSTLAAVYGGGYRFDATITHPASKKPVADGLIGRQEAQTILRSLLQDARLITVWGPGGVGKTSLVRSVVDRGTVWVDLAHLRRVGQVLANTAIALSIPLASAFAEAVERVGQVMRTRGPLVLVFDNFEQLPSACSDLLLTWIDRAPELTIVVTSRRPLAVTGEHILQVRPLEPDQGLTLLVREARKTNPSFDPNHAERAAWLDVVRAVDALPLALELIAPRIGMLPPHALITRMQQSLRLARLPLARYDRHDTLTRCLAWSWSLLQPTDQRALVALSTIPNSFGLEQAEAVIGTPDALYTVDRLADSCWTQRVQGGGTSLYTTAATYARNQLDPSVRTAAEGRRRRWLKQGLGDRPIPWILDHIDDIETAVRRGLRHAPLESARMARAIYWASPALPVERVITLLRIALQQTPPATEEAAMLRLDLVETYRTRGVDTPAMRALAGHLTEDLQQAKQAERTSQQTRTLRVLAALARQDGHTERATQLLQEAITVAANAGLVFREADATNQLGLLCTHLGDPEGARRNHHRALVLFQSKNSRHGQAITLANLGRALTQLGHLDDAERTLRRSLDLLDARLQVDRAVCLGNLAAVLSQQTQLVEASEVLEQALVLYTAAGAPRKHATLAYRLTLVELQLGRGVAAESRALLSIEQLRQGVDTEALANAWWVCALVALLRDDHDLARERLSNANQYAEKSHSSQARAAVCIIEGLLAIHQGEPMPPQCRLQEHPAALVVAALATPNPEETLQCSGAIPAIRATPLGRTLLVLVDRWST